MTPPAEDRLPIGDRTCTLASVDNPSTSAMLIVGHPGHEVRCHGWMARNRPLVLVLTSGGGSCKVGRTASTRRVIEETGARCGALMGDFSDTEVYAFMRDRNPGPLAEWTEQAARIIAERRPATVLTDMVEGYNPSHDLLAYLTHLAVERAAAIGWRPERLFCQPLEGRPESAWNGRRRPEITLRLGEGELASKLAAARSYPELAHEVERALAEHSAEAFRTECLYATPGGEALLAELPEPRPFYEIHGERQVAAGKYASVIRHGEHLVPLARSIAARLRLA